jgi:predicted PurR-regulated permease PerM
MNSKGNVEKKGFLVFFVFLLGMGLYLLSPFLKTLLLSIILGVLFYPLYQKILKMVPRWPNFAAFLSTVSVALFLFFPLLILLRLVAAQLTSLLSATESQNPTENMQALLSQGYVFLQIWITKLEDFFGIHINLLNILRGVLKHLGDYLTQYSPAVILMTASFLFNFLIMLFALFYLFRDGEKFFELSLRLIPLKNQYERKLAAEMRHTIYGVFYGSFLAGLAQAFVATLGYRIAGVDGYLVWGFITFFFSFIPFVGTSVVIVPIVLFLFFQGHVGAAVFLAIYSALMTGLIDNFLKTFLIPSNMHTLVLFLSIMGGLAVFGPLGLLLGPIVMSLLTATIKMYSKDFVSEE